MTSNSTGQTRLPGQATKAFDLMGFFLKRVFMVLPAGAALFLLLGPLVVFVSSTYYETSGRLLITRVLPGIISGNDVDSISSYFKDYARTQVEQIHKIEMLEEALNRLGPTAQATFVPAGLTVGEAAARLLEVIEVEEVKGTHLMQLTLRGGKPDGLAELINALMDVYLEQKQAEQAGQSRERLDYLKAEKKTLEASIAEQESAIEEIANQADIASFSEEYNPFRQQLLQLQAEYARVQVERVKAENEFHYKEAFAGELETIPMDAYIENMVAQDEALFRMNSWTYQTLQTMRAGLDGMAKGNPDRLHVEERMNAMSEYLAQTTGETSQRSKRIAYGNRQYNLKEQLTQAKYDFLAAKAIEENLEQILPATRQKAMESSLRILAGAGQKRVLEQLRERLFQVERRIHELAVEAKAPLRVSVERYARRPEMAAGTNLKKFLLMVGVLAFGMVGTGFLGYDILDDRIRGVSQVRDAVGTPPIRPVPLYGGGGDGQIPFGRVSLDDRTDPAAQAMRSIALRLNREREHCQAKVALFTGVTPGAGVSDVLLNTAHALRQSVDRVLVVEAFCRTHSLARQVRGAKPQGYVHDVVAGRLALADAVLSDHERKIDLLCCQPGEEGQHFTQGTGLRELLQSARQAYDFILVDAPPVRGSDLTEFLALQADLALLVIEADYSLYQELREAMELLVRLEVPAMATVLNWGGHIGSKGWTLRHIPSVPWPLIKRTRTMLDAFALGKMGDSSRAS